MASRRRGAHAAARPSALPFGSARRVPQPAVGGRAPLTGGGNGGKRVSGLRARPPLLRVVIAVLAVGFGAVGFAGGLWSSSSAEPTVQTFLLDWEQGDYRAAAALTTGDPATVATALRTAYRQLHAAAFYLSMGPISQRPDSAEAWFNASVDLGQDGAPWKYQGRFTLRRSGSAWKIQWSPAVINPGLRPRLRLAVVTRMPLRAQLLDATGKPLQESSPVYAVGIRPGQLPSPGATAAALGQATRLDQAQLLGQIEAAPRTPFLQLLTLSPASYARLRHALQKVPGLVIKRKTARLFNSMASDVVGAVGTETSPVLRREGVPYYPGGTVGLSGLQHVYQTQLAGTPTIEVVAESPDGSRRRVLARWAGLPSRSVRTTINANAQQAADAATSAAAGSSAIVAVQSSTGRVLAVADHPAPGLPRISPLAGRYPPGESFTIVSTEALLASHLPVTATIRCPTTYNAGGRNFRNVPAVALGGQPAFAADFAHGCGTAFTSLSRRLDQDPAALTTAAKGFGIGAQWQLPLPAFSGSLPASSSLAGLAANTIGEGDVRVSPLGMAMVAAHVDAGTWHPPSVTSSLAQTQAAAKITFPASRIQQLRTLMRAAVHSGTATQADLAGAPVYGQAGVAPVSRNLWANWFVGYRGNVAFAVLQLSRSPLTSAVPTGAQFLNLLGGR